ncbi:MAG: SDR family oxidoreductase [Nitrospinales bacterium]
MDPERINYHYCDNLNTDPLPPETKILVTGANGYVARRLIPELVARGYFVRCMVRNRLIPFLFEHPRIEVVYGDCQNKNDLWPILKDIKVAYYLIHSMRAKQSKFAQIDRQSAQNFVEVAEACGTKRIIYLGGLGETNPRLSKHLHSRMEVGATLSKSRVTVIRLRAAIIIGAGSASYELLKSLVQRNRWIPFLEEFNSQCQPIAIRDVIKYLVGVMELQDLKTRAFHIGGKDIVSYKNLILRFAKIMNRHIRIFDTCWVPLPVDVLCRVYAYWLHFFISVPVNIISLLLESLRTHVVCADNDILKLLPFERLGIDEAVKRALIREKNSQVFSHWSDVPPAEMKHLLPLSEYESSDFIIEEHSIEIPASSEKIFQSLIRIGGKRGWFHGNMLWRIRGFIDRLFGGIGLQRGRRDPVHLRVGDSLDFWRVEKLERNKELLLRAELISPGYSWLQFELSPGSNHLTKLTLKAHFIPCPPFWGHAYWLLLSKFHSYIFKGMLAHFYREVTGKDRKTFMERVAASSP